jgi:hypothetical protein
MEVLQMIEEQERLGEHLQGQVKGPAPVVEQAPKDLVLAKGENVASVFSLMASTLLFFLKATMTLTDRRLVTKRPTLLWGFIPVGSDAVTFPLQNVAGVRLTTRVSWKALCAGLVMTLLFKKLGLLLGIGLMAGAFATEIAITNAGGQAATFLVSVFERGKAKKMVDRLNLTLAERITSSR